MLVRCPKTSIKFSLILLIIIVWHSASASASVYPFDGIAKGGIYPSSQINTPAPTTPAPITPSPTNSPIPTDTSTPTNTSTSTSFLNSATVHSGQFFDFDNGTETNDVDKADFWWGQIPTGERYLVPKNNATFAITDKDDLENVGCGEYDNYNSSKISIDNNQIQAGTVICTRTNRTYEKTNYTKFKIISSGIDLTISWEQDFGRAVEQPFIFIKINSIPAGAEIWIDGIDEGKLTPDKIYFTGNQLEIPHAYELLLDGYQPYNETFNISKGPINKEATLIQIQAASTPVTPIPATPVPTVSVSATSVQATSISGAPNPAESIPAISNQATSVPVTPVSATSIPATPIQTASVPVVPTAVISKATTSTPSPTAPGFLALPLLIAIFFIYFLSSKNRR